MSRRTKVEQLDWMYSGAAQHSTSLQQDFLLGRKMSPFFQDSPQKASEKAAVGPSGASWKEERLNPDKDIEAKVREDPLFMIKKQAAHLSKRPAGNPTKSQRPTK